VHTRTDHSQGTQRGQSPDESHAARRQPGWRRSQTDRLNESHSSRSRVRLRRGRGTALGLLVSMVLLRRAACAGELTETACQKERAPVSGRGPVLRWNGAGGRRVVRLTSPAHCRLGHPVPDATPRGSSGLPARMILSAAFRSAILGESFAACSEGGEPTGSGDSAGSRPAHARRLSERASGVVNPCTPG
jgi:hypothetical protein